MAKKSRSRRVKVSSKRMKDSYDNRGKGSGNSYLNFSNVEKSLEFFKPVEGTNRINILPYAIASKNHPEVAAGKMEIGDGDYKLELYVHRGMGADHKQSVICRNRMFGKSCPICNEAQRFFDEDMSDEGKQLLSSRRVVYNVQPIKKGAPGDVMIFEVSHALFEKELLEEAKEASDQDVLDFSDPDEGSIIKFRGAEATFGKAKYLEYKSFSFEDREEEIEDEVFDDVVPLDLLIECPSLEQVELIMSGQDFDEDEEEEVEKPKTRNKKSRKVEVEEDDEEDDEEIEEDDESVKKKKSSSKCPHGHTFGEDVDEYNECDKCKKWEYCMEAAGE